MAISPQELVEYRVVFAYQKGRRPTVLVLECSDSAILNPSEPIREWLGVARSNEKFTAVFDLTPKSNISGGTYEEPPTDKMDIFVSDDMVGGNVISKRYGAPTANSDKTPTADILSQDTPAQALPDPDTIGYKPKPPRRH